MRLLHEELTTSPVPPLHLRGAERKIGAAIKYLVTDWSFLESVRSAGVAKRNETLKSSQNNSLARRINFVLVRQNGDWLPMT